MHICEDHEEMLPEGIPPMLFPDSSEEAEALVSCLELNLYPTTVSSTKASATRVPDHVSPEQEGEIQR